MFCEYMICFFANHTNREDYLQELAGAYKLVARIDQDYLCKSFFVLLLDRFEAAEFQQYPQDRQAICIRFFPGLSKRIRMYP